MFWKLECAGPVLRYFTISCCVVYVMVDCLVFVSENWKESPWPCCRNKVIKLVY
jgi:hypothetical protein